MRTRLERAADGTAPAMPPAENIYLRFRVE
jgi:hypothetical protein